MTVDSGSKRVELSLSRQSSIILAAKVFGFVLSFFLPVLVVRLMPQDEVGIYRQVFLIVNTAINILPLGMGMSAYYFLSREPELRNPTVLNILAFLFVLGGLLFAILLAYPNILNILFKHEEMERLSPLIATVIWLWLVGSLLEIVILANREVWLASFAIVGIHLSKAASMILAVIMWPTPEGFLYAAAAQGAIQLAALLYYLNDRFPGFYRNFDFTFFRRHLAYAIPLGLAGILWVFQTDLHNYFVGYRFTPAEFAIYAYGCFQLPLVNLMIESVTAVLIPRISELQMLGDKREIIALSGRSMNKLALVFLPFYAFLFVAAEPFIVTLFSRDYIASVPIFLINLTLIPFAIWINDPVVRAFPELGRFLLYLRIALLVGMTATLVVGINSFGLSDMILVVVLVALTEKAVLTFAVLRKLEANRSDIMLLKRPALTALASGIAGAVTYGLLYLSYASVQSLLVTQLLGSLPWLSAKLADSLANGLILAAAGLLFSCTYLVGIFWFGLVDPSAINREHPILKAIGNYWPRFRA